METFPAETLGDIDNSYVASPFYTDKNDTAVYVANAMWNMFGSVNDGQNIVIKFGNEATWFKWLAQKLMWSGDTGYIEELKSKIIDYPQVDCGFIWSWTTTPWWTVNNVRSLHYDGTFRYISAVYEIARWERCTEFLNVVDTSHFGSDEALDASRGKTVYQKVKSAMDYILENLEGKNGYIRITEKSVLMKDGQSKFFDEWDNTGRFASASSNYWDNLCFGNYDAYENALFYESLTAMAGIENMLGNADESAKYTALAQKVRSEYDRLYWSEATGRYVGTVDVDGVSHDYGLTFLNLEALTYGLGDRTKAKLILDWIDGKRTVEGDTSTGDDIMSYSAIINRYYEMAGSSKRIPDGLYLAPRSNTVSFESKSVDGKSWWHNPKGAISEFGNAGYGKHLENGGYIFYTVFYELMARAAYNGADDVVRRFQQIAEVYGYNKLVSDIGSWLEGLNGEFPENGLTPAAWLYAILGIQPDGEALSFAPAFGTAYKTLGITSLSYGGKKYALEAKKDGSATIKGTGIDLVLRYRPAKSGTVKCVLKSNVGANLATVTAATDENGYATLDLRGYPEALRAVITVI